MMEDTSSPIASSSMASAGNDPEEYILTERFLKGEISFAEYSNKWDAKDDDDIGFEFKHVDTNFPSQLLERSAFPRNKKFTRLSTALLGLMGEANIRFVRGDKLMAEQMCLEIIKQVPTAPEPYQTLAQIYEDTDPDKSLQFSLLAAHLGPLDVSEWLRLAAISHEKNNPKQEMLCYTQAIRSEPHNLDNHLKRIDLLNSLENMNYPIQSLKITPVRCYHKIVTSLPASEGETLMKYMKLAASIYHKNDETEKALEIMTVVYKKCPGMFTFEDINLFLELLFACKQYQSGLEVFITSVGIEVEAEIQTLCVNDKVEEQTNYINCSMPDSMPIDLKCKLIICFIYLGAINVVKTLLQEFLKNDVENTGDLYLDVEEALTQVGHCDLSLIVLECLISSEKYNVGAVWLKQADCLHNLGRDEEAICYYYKVLEQAPQHFEAKQKLFNILESQKRFDAAFNVLQQDHNLAVSAKLLFQECALLKKSNDHEKYLQVGETLLSKSFFRFRHYDELRFTRLSRVSHDVIYNHRRMKGERPHNTDDVQFDDDESFKMSPGEEMALFLDLMNIAYDQKKYHIMQRLCYGAVMAKSLSPYKSDIDFYCLQSSIANGDYYNALLIIRELIQKRKDSREPRIWNLLNHVGQVCEEVNWKYLNRVSKKYQEDVCLVFLGNNFLVSGRYDEALKFYLEYNSKYDNDPYISLVIGLGLLQLGTQRSVYKYNNLFLQGISFLLKYERLRGCDQEVYYNMGRAYQMLSLNNLAIEYYERALAADPINSCEKHGVIDLTKEAAYNLVILYKDHSPDIARLYMSKYLVI